MQTLCIGLGLIIILLVALLMNLWGKVESIKGLREYILHVNKILDSEKVEFERLQEDYEQLQKECVELRVLAHNDSLTGLLNRRTYDEAIKRFKASLSGGDHNRKNGLKSLGFIMIDLDYFKQVNDSHGHNVGDEVLKEVAQAIKTSLRQSDLIFRMGGDEFSALIPNVDNVGMRRLVEKVRKAVEQLTFSTDVKMTISTGGAIAKSEAEVEKLSSLADKALYVAKRKGRNITQIA